LREEHRPRVFEKRVLMKVFESRTHWGNLAVDGRIILRWNFGKWEGWKVGGFGSG